jgi:hypothetical protein
MPKKNATIVEVPTGQTAKVKELEKAEAERARSKADSTGLCERCWSPGEWSGTVKKSCQNMADPSFENDQATSGDYQAFHEATGTTRQGLAQHSASG